jgi:hypothetical protein
MADVLLQTLQALRPSRFHPGQHLRRFGRDVAVLCEGDPFFYAATDPNLGSITNAFFYIHDGCLNPHLVIAATWAIQKVNANTYIGKCPNGN